MKYLDITLHELINAKGAAFYCFPHPAQTAYYFCGGGKTGAFLSNSFFCEEFSDDLKSYDGGGSVDATNGGAPGMPSGFVPVGKEGMVGMVGLVGKLGRAGMSCGGKNDGRRNEGSDRNIIGL